MALFGNNKEQPMAKQISTSAAPNQVNMVGEGTVFEGTLRTEGDVRISGRIIGKLTVGGRAFVSPEGGIEGEVVATNADIGGQVQGELRIQERLILKSTARVEGSIKTGRLIVEEGAIFNGECEVGQSKTQRKKSDLPKEMAVPRRPELPQETRIPEGGPAQREHAGFKFAPQEERRPDDARSHVR
ncbi:MAG: polymer-forming cytoskeletal protein [Rhodothermales bacterium]